MSLPLNQVVCGDAFEVLKGFPESSVDVVMFSPPYWGLRDYKIPKVDDVFAVGGLGLESHPKAYIARMVALCRLLRRVLKREGSLFINLGDTYYASTGSKKPRKDWNRPSREAQRETEKPLPPQSNWLQPKHLLLIPSRCAIALQEDGWILRNDVVWHKPNHMPSSVKDRLTNSWEHIFHFVKSRRYFYDLDAIREQSKTLPHSNKRTAEKSKIPLTHHFDKERIWGNPLGKAPDDTLTTDIPQKVTLNGTMLPHGARIRHGLDGSTLGNEHPLGKNPSDTIDYPYAVQPRTKEFVELRNLPYLTELKAYLNEWRNKQGFTIEQAEEKLQSQAPHHWFNGESYPTKDDWLRIKELLKFDNTYDKQMTETFFKPSEKQNFQLGKNPDDFWSITTQPFPEAHFATYPEAICIKPIKAACPKNGVVLDPMCGSGTTLLVARKLLRNYIGIELNPSYVEIAKKRLATIPQRLDTST